MGFDAFMVRAVAHELNSVISGARVEKVTEPSKDELFFAVHKESFHYKLQINAGAGAPRIGLTTESPENPKVPPMFCMLLRKHLTGAKIKEVRQKDFERVIEIEFETYDEMGFFTVRRLICEIMGRYSNAVLCDENYKIISVLRPVDFTTSTKRQLLPQMAYEYPPSQNKKDPLSETREGFLSTVNDVNEKTVMNLYTGVSPLTSREIFYRAGTGAGKEELYSAFESYIEMAKRNEYTPTLIIDEKGEPFDISPFGVMQYGELYRTVVKKSMGELTDAFFAEKERINRERQRAYSTEKLLKNAENRLIKKLELQRKELEDTEKKSDYKYKADLITANIYRFRDKCEELTVTDYVFDDDGAYTEKAVVIKLDKGLTPAQNAQRLYKKYNKAKNAEREISIQMEKAEAELEYIRSVRDALERINGQADLEEIQRELIESGYDRRSVKKEYDGKKTQKKPMTKSPLKYITNGGFTVLVGKNNLQNDQLTFKTASKNDYWFHVKNRPGSHTVLFVDGKSPSESDLTEAAEIAARNSKAAGEERVEVDYTKIRNVKKPAGSKPGFVIYEGYSTAVVSAKAKNDNADK